uniref:DEAD/DEAH box helicase domain containing protein n=1 Tax=Babesia bovis TaxID=5865 RepID=A7APE7_BABBO|eukprot:XP_001611999.1 DEAD/DEAH box helicase domain containing protein [Babesia bovis T2Bo]
MEHESEHHDASNDEQDITIDMQDGFFDLLDGNDQEDSGYSIANAVDYAQKAATNSEYTDKSKKRSNKRGIESMDIEKDDADGVIQGPPMKTRANNSDKSTVSLDAQATESSTSKQEVNSHLTSDTNWSDLGLSRSLIKAVFDMGYKAPSIIQSKVIPVALEGKDLLATAETGSGKSAAFLIPTLQRLITAGVIKQKDVDLTRGGNQRVGTKALILLPTRELAAQCYDVFLALTQNLTQNGVLITGGVPVKEQEAKLRRMPYIVFATPGKVLDIMLNSNCIHMDAIEIVVLDEADRLLDLGFKDELAHILQLCNKERQTMLFSATLTEATKELVPVALVNPIYIKATPKITVAKTLKCENIQLKSDDLREAAALYLCSQRYTKKTILFFQTKRAAHRNALVFQLAGLKSGELHGDLAQAKRFEQIEKFKNGEVDFLMASELASRGLDIPGISAVINVHLPFDNVRFLHRVGRTARMGEEGTAITFYTEKERSAIKSMMKSITDKGSNIDKQKIKLSGAALKNYKSKIEEMEPKIAELLAAEKVEKELRQCENAIKYGSSTEKRERIWFRSKKQKLEASKNELLQTKLRAITNRKKDNEHEPGQITKVKKNSSLGQNHVKKTRMATQGTRQKSTSGRRGITNKKQSSRKHK